MDAIRGQEKAVENLVAAGTFKTVSWDGKRNAWVPAGELDYVVTYEGVPGGKRRIECRKALTPWGDGPAPFYLESSVAVYDGRVTASLKTQQGDFTRPSEIPTVEVAGNPPDSTMANMASGWAYSLFGVEGAARSDPDGRRFSEFLADSQKLPGFAADEVVRDGKTYLRIRPGGATGFVEYYFLDPAKAYAVARYERTMDDRPTPDGPRVLLYDFVWEVKEFHQPAPNLFFPKRVEGELKKRNGVTLLQHSKAVTTVSKVTLNDPSVNADTYKLKIPKNANLLDPDTGVPILVTGTPAEIQKMMDDAANRARELVGKHQAAPATAPSGLP
jgi:hypothetical protein